MFNSVEKIQYKPKEKVHLVQGGFRMSSAFMYLGVFLRQLFGFYFALFSFLRSSARDNTKILKKLTDMISRLPKDENSGMLTDFD